MIKVNIFLPKISSQHYHLSPLPSLPLSSKKRKLFNFAICRELSSPLANTTVSQENLLFQVFIVGVGLKKPVNPCVEQFTWLYFPEKTVPFYRITFLSRYGEMTPDNNKYWSVLCECARPRDDEQVRCSTLSPIPVPEH